MARTSRKKITANPVQAVSPSQIFPTAIYARLSVENSGKDDEGAALENHSRPTRNAGRNKHAGRKKKNGKNGKVPGF